MSEMLFVNEIFKSIQGESSYSGKPCVFVRLAYCNLRCSYCDTTYAYNDGTEISIDRIIATIREFDCKLVEITGGEPLLQSNVHELMVTLCDMDYKVLLETAGNLDVSPVDPRVVKIVDFKCPSSGAEIGNLWENLKYLNFNDEVKFVIGNLEDYVWAKENIFEHQITRRCSVLMSVVYGLLEPSKLVGWILKDNLDVRFQLQVQKYVWSPDARGV